MTEPLQVNRLQDEAWVAEVTAPGPNGNRYDAHAALLAPSALPGGTVFMYDSVNVAALPAGAEAYAGYYNGTYANLTELKARFPSAIIVSITPNGANGAMYIDIEPGNAVPGDAPGFIKAGGTGFYCSACAFLRQRLHRGGCPPLRLPGMERALDRAAHLRPGHVRVPPGGWHAVRIHCRVG